MAIVHDEVAQAFLAEHTDGRRYRSYFQCSAVALVKKLVGQYLYLPTSKVAVRILETEAYPEGDEVFNRIFRSRREDVTARFKLDGGTLMTWRPPHRLPNEFGDHLYVTAGPSTNSDVVLIRSAHPSLGVEVIKTWRMSTAVYTTNLLIGPSNCAMGVGVEWLHDPKLYTPAGVHLRKAVANQGTKEIEWIEEGARVLPAEGFLGCDGIDSEYRFGLITPIYHRYHSGLQEASYAEHRRVTGRIPLPI